MHSEKSPAFTNVYTVSDNSKRSISHLVHSVLQLTLLHLCLCTKILHCVVMVIPLCKHCSIKPWMGSWHGSLKAGRRQETETASVPRRAYLHHISAMFSLQKGRMCWTFILLVTLSILTHAEAVAKVSVTCPGHQKPYGGTCYEIVGLRHTFPAAQAWCEQRGGHLACIPDEETQLFLQMHLDPSEDFWFGAASCATRAAQDSPSEGERFKQALRFASCSKNDQFRFSF